MGEDRDPLPFSYALIILPYVSNTVMLAPPYRTGQPFAISEAALSEFDLRIESPLALVLASSLTPPSLPMLFALPVDGSFRLQGRHRSYRTRPPNLSGPLLVRPGYRGFTTATQGAQFSIRIPPFRSE